MLLWPTRLWASLAVCLWCAGAALAGEPAELAGWLLDVDPGSHERVAELSGLAWDAPTRRLYAVSDRGRLYVFRPEPLDDTPRRLVLLAAHPLRRPGGGAMDAEAIALHRDGPSGEPQLVVASEKERRVWRMDTAGHVLSEHPLPASAQRASLQVKSNRGIESVALMESGELLVAFEGVDEDGLHAAHGAERSWRWRPVSTAATRVKDMALGPSDVVHWIERDTTIDSGTRVYLRSLALSTCQALVVCEPLTLGWLPRPKGRGNYEGLTRLGGSVWLAVADDAGAPGRLPVFVLFVAP